MIRLLAFVLALTAAAPALSQNLMNPAALNQQAPATY